MEKNTFSGELGLGLLLGLDFGPWISVGYGIWIVSMGVWLKLGWAEQWVSLLRLGLSVQASAQTQILFQSSFSLPSAFCFVWEFL